MIKTVARSLTLLLLLSLVAPDTAHTAEVVVAETTAQASLFPVVKDGKCGYIDRTGQIIIAPQFDRCEPFSDGLALARIGCHHAYVDRAGKVVIQLDCGQFTLAFPFSEGMAVVGQRGPGDAIEDTLGFIDKTGKVVIPLQFDEARAFAEGLAVAAVRHSRGYIDKSGKFVIEPRYGTAGDFSEGLARVGAYVQGLPKEHFIDRTGRRAIRREFRFIDDFHEGLAAVWVGEEKGFIDRSGALVIQPQPFDSVDHFSDGLARVQTGGPMGKGGRLGFIDRAGKMVVQPRYDFSGDFSEGLCAVAIGEKYGYIDKMGAVVVEPRFRIAAPFRDGLAAVWIGNAMGYIDKTGKFIWGPAE